MKLTVYGVPATKGSSRAFPKRSGGTQVVPDNRASLKAWEARVREAGQKLAERRQGALLTSALSARATWWLQRPKGHLSARGGLVPSAPPYPIGKPDLDKLARAIFDALQGVLYTTDAQLVELHVKKRYADPGTAPHLDLELLVMA